VFFVAILACAGCTAAAPQPASQSAPTAPAAAVTVIDPVAGSAEASGSPSSSATATSEPTNPATLAPTSRATAAPPATVAPQPSTPRPATATPTSQPATATPQATVQTQTPAPSQRYTTLPPGAALPSEAQCLSQIVRNTWEPRPENTTANQNNAWTNGFRLRASYIGTIFPAYELRVTGNFTGTTDQIIRWAACKWGFDEEDVRAQAVAESTWRQSHLGDCGLTTQPETNGCASVGLMQIKGANIPATHPGTWPAALTSTAFNLDYTLAVRRLCYEGKETWMRKFNPTYAAGDVWGCIGRWFSGNWRDAAAETYIAQVKATLNARPWLSASF